MKKIYPYLRWMFLTFLDASVFAAAFFTLRDSYSDIMLINPSGFIVFALIAVAVLVVVNTFSRQLP